jgi:methionine aminopeptidase
MVRELISHSIRREMYENPKVLNYDIAEKEPELKLGVTLAVEPTSTIDKPKILVDSDG